MMKFSTISTKGASLLLSAAVALGGFGVSAAGVLSDPNSENLTDSGDCPIPVVTSAATEVKAISVAAQGGSATVTVGDTVVLNVTAKVTGDNKDDVAKQKAAAEAATTWKSADDKKATVTAGPAATATVTGVAEGKVVITATSDKATSKTATIEIEVTEKSSGSGSGSGSGGGGGSSSASTNKPNTVTDSSGNSVTTNTTTNSDGTKTVSNTYVNQSGTTVEKTITVNTEGDVEKVVVTNTTASGTTSVKTTYTMSNGNLTLKKAVVKKASYTVPNTVSVIVDGKETQVKVTAIGKNALKGNTKIKTLTVGKNIKSIGANAFKNAKNLKTITLKGKITKVGKNAFKGINKKATIKIKGTAKTYKATVKAIKKSGIAKTVKFKRVK